MVLRRGVMRRQAILVWAVLCCLAFLLCTSTAFGQAVYGSIIGTVTDPQGTAVAVFEVNPTLATTSTSIEGLPDHNAKYSRATPSADQHKTNVAASAFILPRIAN